MGYIHTLDFSMGDNYPKELSCVILTIRLPTSCSNFFSSAKEGAPEGTSENIDNVWF